MRSKKGARLVVTMFTIVMLIIVFIIFFIIYKQLADAKRESIKTQFSSTNTELYLKSFLRAPVLGNQPRMPEVGEFVSNADVAGMTCNNKKTLEALLGAISFNHFLILDKNSFAFERSAAKTFDPIYGKKWDLWIIYSGTFIATKRFGHSSLIESVMKDLRRLASYSAAALAGPMAMTNEFLFHTPYRDAGFATQIIPCDGGRSTALIVLRVEKTDMLDVFMGEAPINTKLIS